MTPLQTLAQVQQEAITPYTHICKAHEKAIQAQQKKDQERDLKGWTVGMGYSASRQIHLMVDRFLMDLCEQHRQACSTDNKELIFDKESFISEYLKHQNAEQSALDDSVNLVHFAQHLENSFSQEEQDLAAFKEIAKDLFQALGLHFKQPVKTKRGWEFTRSVSLDSVDKKCGKTRLCYSSRDDIRTLKTLLTRFSVAIKSPEIQKAVESAFAQLPLGIFDEITSRKWHYSDDNQVSVQTFQNKVIYVFSDFIFEHLQIFISEYHQLEQAA